MPHTTENVTEENYHEFFKNKEKNALNHALETRKFEIELYWKRATYFWTFIGATMAGYFAIQASDASNKQDLGIILSCLGFVFSSAWFCVNRGSKFWQENWEKHVDMLENTTIGPLHKIVLSRNKTMGYTEKAKDILTGPANLSVSKINQLISAYITLLWLALLYYSLPEFSFDRPVNIFYATVISASLLTAFSFYFICRSYSGGYYHTATIRKSRIKPKILEKQSSEPVSGPSKVN